MPTKTIRKLRPGFGTSPRRTRSCQTRQKRARFDRGEEFTGDLFSNFGGLDEILSQFFGGVGGFGFGGAAAPSRRGQDIAVALDLDLAEAAFGVSHDVSFLAPVLCDVCEGSGAKAGHTPSPCSTCAGHGQVQATRNTFLGSMTTVQECPTCRGRGSIVEDPCEHCSGAGRRQSRGFPSCRDSARGRRWDQTQVAWPWRRGGVRKRPWRPLRSSQVATGCPFRAGWLRSPPHDPAWRG